MAKGKVVQVIGTVVDMEFPQNELPAINNGIVIPYEGVEKSLWRYRLISATTGCAVLL